MHNSESDLFIWSLHTKTQVQVSSDSIVFCSWWDTTWESSF